MRSFSFILTMTSFLLMTIVTSAQVGINSDGSAPNSSSMLDVKSTNRGLLPPRMTTIQRDAIATPAEGLTIYNIDCHDLQYFNGNYWVPLGHGKLLPTPGAITGSTSPCTGAQAMPYSIQPIPGASAYLWSAPQGATIASGQGTTSVSINFGTFSGSICVTAQSNCYSSMASCLDVSILSSAPPSITIAPSVNPSCEGSAVTFTATSTNSGSFPQFQWRVNGNNILGATTSTYNYIPANLDAVSCQLIPDLQCFGGLHPVSNVVTMTVNPLQPTSVSIAAPGEPACLGNPVTLTATPINGGSNPAFQWTVNNNNITGATSNTYTYTPSNDDVVSCVMTSNAQCVTGNPATSNAVTLVVTPLLPVSVTITASSNPALLGTMVTFAATPVNGGSNPTYLWKVNGIVVGSTNNTFSYSPTNNDQVQCILTSNLPCTTGNPATSNTIAMTVNNMNIPCPGTPTVSYGGKTYNTVQIGDQCWLKENLKVGTRISGTLSQTNNGIIEKYCLNNLENNCDIYGGLYQWGETMSYLPSSNSNASNRQGICPAGWHLPSDDEWCQLKIFLDATVNCTSTGLIGTDAGGKMKEVGLTHWLSPNTGATNQSGFTGLPGGNRTVSGGFVNSPSDALYWSTFESASGTAWATGLSWNSAAVGRNSWYSKLDGYAVRCIKDTCSSYSSTGVSVWASANPVCAGTSVTFTATPTNGGATPFYQWKVNATFVGTNSPTYVYIPANGDTIRCIMTSSTPCTANPSSSNVVNMIVNAIPAGPVAGTHLPSQNQIQWNWNAVTGAIGYKWNTSNDYATAFDMGTATTKTESGLTPGTLYTRYIWAYNSCGVSPVLALAAQTTALSVGMAYCGGIIFYIDGTGQHGLIASPNDQGTVQWGCYGHLVSGTLLSIGVGQSNTNYILASCSDAGIAAKVCNDLALNGYDDWFLPSYNELSEMYDHQIEIGGFSTGIYWSSSEDYAMAAYGKNFANGWMMSNSKSDFNFIRAIRAF